MVTLINREEMTSNETHFVLDVNGKEIFIAKWHDIDWYCEWEIYKGSETLNETENQEVVTFMGTQS
jgi:hypothetical protein